MSQHAVQTTKQANTVAQVALLTLIVIAMAGFTPEVLAQTSQFGGTEQKVCGFFSNIKGLLGMVSIAVVTIAVIFAGYQIAFAHKRIADVAPILIGGLLIGAATQIATMLIGDTGQTCTSGDAADYLINIIGTVA